MKFKDFTGTKIYALFTLLWFMWRMQMINCKLFPFASYQMTLHMIQLLCMLCKKVLLITFICTFLTFNISSTSLMAAVGNTKISWIWLTTRTISTLMHHGSFFATSHAKSPCDGIGGTVKRKLAKANLMRLTHDQLLTVQSVYQFCTHFIDGINFFFISKEELVSIWTTLSRRFIAGNTVPGTCLYHHFASEAVSQLKFKCTSLDENYCGTHSFFHLPAVSYAEILLMSYIACIYDNKWWIGLVDEKDSDEGDMSINFLHPDGPSSFYYWPFREDNCTDNT